jgi:hypothetical protein
MTTDLGGHSEWLPHVDKLILEMLANRTPPSCIQANIFAMSRVLQPEQDIVKELPSLNHIKNLRTVLLYCTKTLAAYHCCESIERGEKLCDCGNQMG